MIAAGGNARRLTERVSGLFQRGKTRDLSVMIEQGDNFPPDRGGGTADAERNVPMLRAV